MAVNFTKVSIEALTPPAKGWQYHRDSKVPGLALGIGTSGIRTFVLYKRINGSPERIKLGRYPDMTIEQARRKATELNGQIAAGKNPAEAKREKRAEMTLQELFELYIERYATPHGIKTVATMRELFNVYLGKLDAAKKKHGRERVKPAGSVDWSKRQISTISHKDTVKLHHELGTKTGKTIANRIVELLRAVFNRCSKLKLIDLPNPAEGIEPFKEVSRDRFLRADEFPRFFDALEAESEQNRDFFLLALLTGARKSNVLGMRWQDVDLVHKHWRVPGQYSKNGKPMVIPLTRIAEEILARRRKQALERIGRGREQVEQESDRAVLEGYVFPGIGASGHMTSPKRAWGRVLERARLTDVRPHDLRRSLGSWMASTGASLAVIGGALGHKDSKSTEVYARLAIDPVKEAMERAQGAIFGLGGNPLGGD